MITLKPIPRDELLRQAHEQFVRKFPQGQQAEVKNTGAVLGLYDDGGPVYFRGRPFDIPPVSYADGVRLQQVAIRLRDVVGTDATVESLPRYQALLGEMPALIKSLVRPRGWRRYVWKLYPNPFRRATETELYALLNFLAGRRTTSSVRQSPSPADR